MANYGPTPSAASPTPLYARHIHGGETVDFIPAAGTDYGAGVGAGVPYGAVIILGSLAAIAMHQIPAATQGSLTINGCFEFPKAASDGGMASGTIAYWDASQHIATATASGNTYLGKVEPPGALTADTVVRITIKGPANASGTIGFGAAPVSAVTAAGSTVSDAAALSVGVNVVTGADGTKGVVLPTAPTPGTIVIVKGVTSATLKVYPDAAATINAIASHANISLTTVVPAIFVATSTTQWYTIPLVPS